MSSTTTVTRRARLCLQIIDSRGRRWYTITPLSPTDDFAVGFRLSYAEDATQFYSVTLSESGAVRCSCAGHASHRRCKHADALQALALIDADAYLAARKAQLEAEQERDLLQRDRQQVAEERRLVEAAARVIDNDRKPKARARRLHQPANPLSNPADDLRAAMMDIDVTTTAGQRKAKNACRAIAARHDMPANDLWRDVCYQPQGFAETVA